MRRYEDKNGKEKRTRKPSSVGESYDAAFRGYINLTLSQEQKSAYDAWAVSSSFWEVFEGAVSDGVNLSVRVDPKSDGFLGSATQRRVGSPNAGLVVTARATTAEKALGRVVFTLAVLSHAERWEDMQPLADPDRW